MPVSFTRWEQGGMPHEASVALCEGTVGLHTGLAYLDASTRLGCVLHLAWHHQLQNDHQTAPDQPWFLIDPGLDDIEQDLIASFCQLLARKMPRIPYAFRFAFHSISQTGSFVPNPSSGGIGLTCASFVMAVFEAAGVKLLQEPSWQGRTAARIDDDRKVQEQLAHHLKRRATAAHAAAVEAQVGCTRFRSEEVAAASHFQAPATAGGGPSRPVTFTQAEPEGRDLRERIEAVLAR